MGRKLMVRLTSCVDGKRYEFDSYTDAGRFLHRSHAYLNVCRRENRVPSNLKTGETFKYEILGFVIHKNRIRAKATSPQLCNKCARAGGFCSWSENLTPVKGWEAEESVDADGNFFTWHILGCPLYMEEAKTVDGRKEQRRLLVSGGA